MSERSIVNVGVRLTETAREMPDAPAVIVQRRRDLHGQWVYGQWTFRQLDRDSDRLAAGMRSMGIGPGARLALMVKPGFDFISLTFALFKVGAVTILIDPGMGLARLLECLDDVEPDGFVAIPIVQAVRAVSRRPFAKATLNVTVGRRWFWGGPTLRQFRARPHRRFEPARTGAEDPAAVIFTSGSTGPAKGVLYRHGNFDQQVDQIRDRYEIAPGGIDLAAFPLFALFDAAMGTATLIPKMDASRPAAVNPRNVVEAIDDWRATQAFASPAVWDVVGQYCKRHEITLPSMRCVLSAGAPVPPRVLAAMTEVIAPDGRMYTPYGATESLPVASISAREVLDETAAMSRDGAGTCVGRRYSGIEWKVIRTDDGPIDSIDRVVELPTGEIGELIVRGPVVTREYVARVEANALSKIADGEAIWHRIGDLGYLDEEDRFWFCGRKSHRVETAEGTMYSVPCEAIINTHSAVFRSALVGVGASGRQTPVIVVETWPGRRPKGAADREKLRAELRDLAASHRLTDPVRHVLLHASLPVDVRHNAKIFREKLAVWAETELAKS